MKKTLLFLIALAVSASAEHIPDLYLHPSQPLDGDWNTIVDPYESGFYDYRWNQRDQSELVIIITAHLVTPTHGAALMVPTDRIRPPSEFDLFVNGATEAVALPTEGAAGEVARQDFGGSYGYVMED